MIAIIDNGKGAEDLARMMRGAKVVKPGAIPDDADAYILSDGEMDKKAEAVNVALIKKSRKPILGVGIGYIYLAKAYGASVIKPSACPKAERIKIEQRSPILLDLKKNFSVVDEQKHAIGDLPEDLGVIASCPKNPYEVIQHGANLENPLDDPLPQFGIHFNPERGLEGKLILDNFARFVEMWSKYH
jgi:GMP synthase-like glutamine amidotransferase